MIFEVGKVYQGYTVEGRTKCFVTFRGQKRRKIEIVDGIESVPIYTYCDGIEHIVDVEAIEDVSLASAEVTVPDTHIEVSANRIINPKPVSGASDGENIVVIDGNNQQWQLVDADTQNCLFEAVEHREIGSDPRTRTMPLSEVQALYGWSKPKRDPYIRPSLDFGGIGIEVHCGHAAMGYALAEPIWAERTDDPNWADLERERMARVWDRDCDRVANFAMSARAYWQSC